MEINKELIQKVAKNARLKLTEEEIKEFVPQFEEILKSFSDLDKVNTKGVSPGFHPIEIKNAVREDEVEKCVSLEVIMRNAKHKKDNYFLGPKAL